MKKSLPKYFFLLLVFTVTVAFLGLVGNFLLSIFWAVVLTILFHKRFEKIKAQMPDKTSRAAGLTVGYAVLILIVPLLFVSGAVVFQAIEIAEKISESDTTIEDQVEEIQDQIPIKNKTLKKYGLSKKKIEKKVSKKLEDGKEAIAGQVIGITQNIFGLITNFFLSLYIFFFFLRDGKQIIRMLMWVIPMKDKQEVELMNRFDSVARATVKGSLVVAFIQGFIGGLAFWALGIDAALLWGIIMVIAALLPFGSALIWGPWAIILLFQGAIGKGIILIIIGSVFIGLIDNFLHPRLVGQDAKMPDYLILIATLGGLAWFGLSGFVIGPVIAALFVTCWQMMGQEYGKDYNRQLALIKMKKKKKKKKLE